MTTKLQNFKLPVELVGRIETLSNGGNKTATVIDLLNQALAMRDIEEDQRFVMYSGIKRFYSERGEEVSPKLSRNIIDGLWI